MIIFNRFSIVYCTQTALNLVNQTGTENELASAFKDAVSNMEVNKIGYEAFDFHRQCGRNAWHKLSILMDRIELEQTEFGYFLMVSF